MSNDKIKPLRFDNAIAANIQCLRHPDYKPAEWNPPALECKACCQMFVTAGTDAIYRRFGL